MKYRNFDPETDQPVSAVTLIEKLSTGEEGFALGESFDIATLLRNQLNQPVGDTREKEAVGSNSDLTLSVLNKYDRIASIINSESIRSKSSRKDHQEKADDSSYSVAEFDSYLEKKYKVAERTNEVISGLLKDRFKELME